MSAPPPMPWTTALALAALACASGCEGVTVEIVEPAFPDGPSPVVEWELWLEAVDGDDACPPVRELSFAGEPLRLPAPAEVAPLEGVALSPGRYSVVAVGRDAGCAPVLFGQTCIGPEAPPRVVQVIACDVGAEDCAGTPTSPADRGALACAGACDAGACR